MNAIANTLNWTDALSLNQPQIDQTHQEFVALLNELGGCLQAAASSPLEVLPIYQRLLVHTEAHFAIEEGFMAATGFAADNCHSKQHAMVLDVMREVLVHTLTTQDLAPLRNLLTELANWFPAHAEMMDAALVFHMTQVGFDPATGSFVEAALAGAAPISSCGSGSCG
ncbi:hemerythrin domain-containing protein [Roseateles sp.]|uniref:bacteriohemerythrin n=1 Tax=Roseateles sp. TaxID=1971397 RepID=UPI00286C26F8|nr:hemerythrin domain-containing protein [Roseateles sp.]